MINIKNIFIRLLSSNIIPSAILLFFLGVFLLARTFMGIYIFGFRIGELAILFSLLSLIISISFFNKFSYTKLFLNTKIRITLILFVVTFIFNLILSASSPINPYTFKSSSYIWSIGFLFLGLYFANFYKLNKNIIRLFTILNFYLYYFSFYGISEGVQNQLLVISDKFEYHKGSDVFLLLISSLFLMIRFEKEKRISLEILLLTFSFFSPLLLYKSRGAFIGFLVFVLLELFSLRRYFKMGYVRNMLLVILMTILFLQSLSLVTKNGLIEVDEVRSNVDFITSYRAIPSSKIIEEKLFYMYENRLYSSDGNLNWRFQIWQDVIHDLSLKNKLLFGYGYKSIIPAMDDPFRAGDDGTNENVHNFIVNIFARGGLVHFLLFILLFMQIFKYSSKFRDLKISHYIFPIFLVSFFDSSMENSHFPLIFYFIIGYLFQVNENALNKNEDS